jgi:TonB family protein
MKSCRFGLHLLAVLFFAHLSALRAQSATAPTVPPAAGAAQRASFERLGDLLDRDEVAEGALELAALAAPVNAPAPTPAEKAILQRAVAIGRRHLKRADESLAERNAARHLVCLARSHSAEELFDPQGENGKPVAPLSADRVVDRPEIAGRVKPKYTAEAGAKRLTGTVILEIVIDREGCVREARVLKGLPFGLNESALAAVKGWAFEPATLDGKPVRVYYVATVNFLGGKGDKVSMEASAR